MHTYIHMQDRKTRGQKNVTVKRIQIQGAVKNYHIHFKQLKFKTLPLADAYQVVELELLCPSDGNVK
jgi:hypothetical protein